MRRGDCQSIETPPPGIAAASFRSPGGNRNVLHHIHRLARPTEHPDLVFMDVQMSGVDGSTATRQLRQRGGRIPVVALTAHAMSEDRDRRLACGRDESISKPATQATLIAGVQRMCPQFA